MEKKRFLDYEGLNKYNDLILSLIKSGDSELLSMIEDIKELIEGSDSGSVTERIAELENLLNEKIKTLESKHDADKQGLQKEIEDKVSNAVSSIVDGAPEAFDTLKEIAAWISSDESGTADLIAEVAANKKAIEDNKSAIDADVKELTNHMEAAASAFENHDGRIDALETIIGVDGGSEAGETLMDRVSDLEDYTHEEPGSITDAEIALLFASNKPQTTTVKYADDAASIKSISAAQAKTSDLIVTSSEAVNALTENKTYKNIAIGGSDITTKLTVKAVESIAIDGANVNGREEGATGNGSVNFAAKELVIKNVNISGNTNYNVFEGTQDLTNNSSHIEVLNVSDITVEDPSIKHNIVNVYTPANGAKIRISNSKFVLNADNSNVLRVSNYLNSDNVEITFDNCDWEYVGGNMNYAGLMIYQPASADVALSGDMSHLATWRLRFVNCRYNGNLITENVSGENQAFYTYDMGGSKKSVGGADAITSVGWKVIFE